ncbi:R3H domain-containing protein 1-like [Chenopodium quinoa]|uniref:R3H domain-containing protein 1-like n=1 Tax=Chenopodium quinoa TaxID=63459 RepID=UPI000B78BB4B|nr:R3H domain-containing protein 1-like [Chenopodium quinoa]
MSITQFAMVEELGSLIKDNYLSRHLVLAVEEALVNYLQDDPSPGGILELEPMSSYNRLIIHRLADIFGFVHESVGEGNDRHLVLQQCLETSIPSILVSDVLWQYGACDSPSMPYQLLRRDEECTVLKMNLPSAPNFVEREAAYLAARERIFGMDEVQAKEAARQRPRNVPVVARRMIAHALGQRINHCNQNQGYDARHSNGQAMVDDLERSIKYDLDLHHKSSPDSSVSTDNIVECISAEGNNAGDCFPAAHGILLPEASDRNSSGSGHRPSGRNGLVISKMSMKEENMGAAKRMFAHALGIPASKDGISRGK